MTPYPDGKTWYLMGPLVYSRPGGDIKVPEGFETDFASVPQALTNVLPRWSTYGPASVVHDWLYWNQQTHRDFADEIIYEAMVALGVNYWKRRTIYNAVRMFGQSAWDSNERIAMSGYSRVRTSASPPIPEWTRD